MLNEANITKYERVILLKNKIKIFFIKKKKIEYEEMRKGNFNFLKTILTKKQFIT